jgi:Autophagy protein Apg5
MSTEVDPAAMQAVNWGGSIPVHLTLAPTSVSSPTLPPVQHILVSRQTFLHAGLLPAVQRLHPFAPCSPFLTGRAMLHISEPDPGGESDGDENDTKKNEAAENDAKETYQVAHSTNSAFVYPPCWFEDDDTKMAVRWHLFAGILFDLKLGKSLPWKLKLHFTNYPSSQILPLEHPVLSAVQATYKHSLKQAMTVVSSNSRTAMNVTKESHGLLWEAVTTANFQLYQRVDLVSPNPVAIPIRVMLNSNPPMQRRVDGETTMTLGRLLHTWLPEHFSPSFGDAEEEEEDTAVKPNETVKLWRVCGIEPPLTTPILDLWKNCSHPDHFLYVVVLTTTR